MRHHLALPLAFAAAVALAGCHGTPPDDGTPGTDTVRLAGWFSDYNDTIAEDFDATVAPYSDDVLLMESFPPGFQIRGLDPLECPELQGRLLEKDYLASVGECEEVPDTTNGDDPVSSDDP